MTRTGPVAVLSHGLLLCLGLGLGAGCKNAEQQAVEAEHHNIADLVNSGRTALAEGRTSAAVAQFKEATAINPSDPMLYRLLAEAQEADGNDGAAVLALKQAEDNGLLNDPAVKRERAEIYRRMGQTKEAIATLIELRDDGKLTESELLMLTQLQAHNGEPQAAYKTLEKIQAAHPDDPNAKAVEAEVLLATGDEILAAKLMDRLLQDNPSFEPARLLRARYFLQNGYPDRALQDLDAISDVESHQSEVVELRARVYVALKRYDDAVHLLEPLVQSNPRDADLACQLAEIQLLLGKVVESQNLIENALGQRPRFPRALYVRARTFEGQDDLKQALENYEAALKSDPNFTPALSRIWVIQEKNGNRAGAIGTLERLLVLNEATLDEKVALVKFYLETGNNLDRGKKIIDDVIRVQPNEASYKELKDKLLKAAPNKVAKPVEHKIIIERQHHGR